MPKNSGLKRCREIAEEEFSNYKTELIRGEDIPFFVENLVEKDKKVIGIAGEDLFKEYLLNNRFSNLQILKKYNWIDEKALFKKPVLCLLGPKGKKLEDLSKNLKVAINKKYMKIAKNYLIFLETKGFNFQKMYFSGSTEEVFQNNICDLVIDIVYSGKSIQGAGLVVYNKIFESNIVIIGKKEMFDLGKLDFGKMNGLIPTIIKDKQGNILTLVYSSRESLKKTLETKKVYSYSRKRKKVNMKGETSGNIQEILDIKMDCDNDALIFIVKQKGNACHLQRYSCFEEKKKFDFQELYNKIKDRIENVDEKSFTKKLVDDQAFLFRKIIEEAGEVVTAKDRENLIWEIADLFYFIFVLMAKNDIVIEDIEKENERRDKETLLNRDLLLNKENKNE